MEFIDEGLYDLPDFLTLFHFLTRFNNPIGLNIQELEDRIIGVMEKSQPSFNYKTELDFYLSVGEEAEFKDSLTKIKLVALKINENIRRKNLEEESLELQELCYSNFTLFTEKLLDRQGKYFYKPVFLDFNADQFLKFYNENPSLRLSIIKLFANRYQYYYMELKPEKTFLANLLIQIDRLDQQQQGKNVTGDLLKKFQRYLSNAINLMA